MEPAGDFTDGFTFDQAKAADFERGFHA
jgi:hypothetical protein